jgi:hypothetical protein
MLPSAEIKGECGMREGLELRLGGLSVNPVDRLPCYITYMALRVAHVTWECRYPLTNRVVVTIENCEYFRGCMGKSFRVWVENFSICIVSHIIKNEVLLLFNIWMDSGPHSVLHVLGAYSE